MTIQTAAIQQASFEPDQAGVIRRRSRTNTRDLLLKAKHFEFVTDADGLIVHVEGDLPSSLGTPEHLLGRALASLMPVDAMAGHERRRRYIHAHPQHTFRSVLPIVTSRLHYLSCAFFVQGEHTRVQASNVTSAIVQALVLADPGELMRVTVGEHDVCFSHVSREVDSHRQYTQDVQLLYLRSEDDPGSLLATTRAIYSIEPGVAVYPARRDALWLVLVDKEEAAFALAEQISQHEATRRLQTGIASLHPITQNGRELMLAAAIAWASIPLGRSWQMFPWEDR